MKAISLWQPWASAIALGLKGYETRGRKTNLRERIAIHAAKHYTKAEMQFARERRAVRDPLPDEMPLGVILATARIWGCARTEDVAAHISSRERAYGNYGPGRFAWILDDVIALEVPIPFKGMQGFFEVPDNLFTDLERLGNPRAPTALNPACAWPFPVSGHQLALDTSQ